MTNKKKLLLAVACMALAVCSLVTGTLAWLTAKTDPVVNTFAPSNITLYLTETTGSNYKMIPGTTYAKDPKVTVVTDIDCYVFVKVTESVPFKDLMSYVINQEWTKLEDGVYYREVGAGNWAYNVLEGKDGYANGYVEIDSDLTLGNMPATAPELTFTAYAVQKLGFNNAAAAWAQIKIDYPLT